MSENTIDPKNVISISLGSSSGDFSRTIILNGLTVNLKREGTNGDLEHAKEKVRLVDGCVDAIGLGGIDICLRVRGEKFFIGEGLKLAEQAHVSPVVDGSGLKDTLERSVTRNLVEAGLIYPGIKVLMVNALDRFGMAEALIEAGCICQFGDLIFNLGIDYPLTTLDELHELATKYRKRLLTTPFHMLYPTGSSQDETIANPNFAKYYLENDVIAGDRHLISKHLPNRIDGKGILTNTTRESVVKTFRDAGATWLATTTPEMEGVSGGTNLMEAALTAVVGCRLEDLSVNEVTHLIENLGWTGSIHPFTERRGIEH